MPQAYLSICSLKLFEACGFLASLHIALRDTGIPTEATRGCAKLFSGRLRICETLNLVTLSPDGRAIERNESSRDGS